MFSGMAGSFAASTMLSAKSLFPAIVQFSRTILAPFAKPMPTPLYWIRLCWTLTTDPFEPEPEMQSPNCPLHDTTLSATTTAPTSCRYSPQSRFRKIVFDRTNDVGASRSNAPIRHPKICGQTNRSNPTVWARLAAKRQTAAKVRL